MSARDFVHRPGGDSQASNDSACQSQRSRFKIVPLKELLQRKPPKWLVKDVIREGAFAVLFAASKHFKSFTAIALAFALASGTNFLGHSCRKARVLYLVGEGEGSFMLRCKAWLVHHHEVDWLDGTELQVFEKSVSLLDSHLFNELFASIAVMPLKPDLIIIDTLARYFGDGDENSAQAMNRFVAACDRLRTEFGCAVLVLHHTGKRQNGVVQERGSSALGAAADVRLHLVRSENNLALTGVKAKDGKELEPTYGRAIPIALGADEDGEPLSSLVVVPSTKDEHPHTRPKRDPGAEIREALREHFPSGAKSEDLCAQTSLKRTQFYEHLKVEVGRGRIHKQQRSRGCWYLLPEAARPDRDPDSVRTDAADRSGGPASPAPESGSTSAPPPLGGGVGPDERTPESAGRSSPRKKMRKAAERSSSEGTHHA